MLNDKGREVVMLRRSIQVELVTLTKELGRLCDEDELDNIDTEVYNWPYLHNNHNLMDSTVTYSVLSDGIEYFFSYACPYEGGVDEFSFKVYDRWMGMSYEEILKDIISLSKNKRGKEKEQKLIHLQRLCKELGYTCEKEK